MENEQRPKKIIVFGRTGVGKTTLLNKIAGKELFKPGHTLISETSRVESRVITWPLSPYYEVELFDVPGFGDNREDMSPEVILAEIAEFLLTLEDEIHVALFCISAKTRVDAHDLLEFDLIRLLLGKQVLENVFVAVTQINTLGTESRQAAYTDFRNQLPMILAQHDHPGFTKERIVFGDFDNFESQFLTPINKILPDLQAYTPVLAQFDPDHPETFKKLIESKEIQEYQQKMESKLEAEYKKYTALEDMYKKEMEILERTRQETQKGKEAVERRLEGILVQLEQHNRQRENDTAQFGQQLRKAEKKEKERDFGVRNLEEQKNGAMLALQSLAKAAALLYTKIDANQQQINRLNTRIVIIKINQENWKNLKPSRIVLKRALKKNNSSMHKIDK